MCGLMEAGSLETEASQGSMEMFVSPVNGVRICSVTVKLQFTEGTQISCYLQVSYYKWKNNYLQINKTQC
jgi:hypothetical protein